MVQTLLPILNYGKSNYLNSKIKNLTLKILLKLSLTKLCIDDLEHTELNKIFFQCFYAIYETSVQISNTENNLIMGYDNTSTSSTVAAIDDNNHLNLLIEFLNKIVIIFNDSSIDTEFFKPYIKQIINNNKKCDNNDQEYKTTADTSLTDIDIFDCLNIAYTCLRNYTANENYRKYLIHLSIIDTLHQLSKITFILIQRLITLNSNNNNNKKTAVTITLHTEEKPHKSQILIFAILRNFTLDTSGKSKIVSENMANFICNICSICLHHSEIVLNVTRILAKLSLTETFRAQLNSDDINIGINTN